MHPTPKLFDQRTFNVVCANGHLEMARWLWRHQTFPTRTAFKMACTHNHLEMAQWLWGLSPPIDLYAQDNEIFAITTSVRVVRWLYTLVDPQRPLPKCIFSNNRLWVNLCQDGHLSMAKFIWDVCCRSTRWMSSHVDHRFNKDEPFRVACEAGRLDVAQWLWDLDPTNRPDHRAIYDEPFRAACMNGHFGVAQWLWDLCPSNRPQQMLGRCGLFTLMCVHNNLQMAMWLWDIMGEDRKHIDLEMTLYLTQLNGRIRVIKWLSGLISSFSNLT